jgi:hypothetical protein
VAKLTLPLPRHLQTKNRGIALLSLAEYKVAMGVSGDYDSLVKDFSRPMETTRGLSRVALKSLWLEPYYKNILRKEQPTALEVRAASAARQVARKYAKQPTFYIEDLFDGRKQKRLTDKLSKV